MTGLATSLSFVISLHEVFFVPNAEETQVQLVDAVAPGTGIDLEFDTDGKYQSDIH